MNWAVVMTGGRGTRFWPLSRARHPKPFLQWAGSRTLLEETVHRLRPLFSWDRIVIVLQDSLLTRARRLFPRIPARNFLGEPRGRNTAACCVWAASRIERGDADARVVFLPADQHIHPRPLFLKTLRTAFEIVGEKPVLLGIRPDSPHPGYGYLEVDQKRKTDGLWTFRVKRFREKPDLAAAKRFLRRGNFFWNGGTFIWRLPAFRRAVRQFAPKIYSAWDELSKISTGGATGRSSLQRIYRKLPSISIDYAVMEKMKNVSCLLAPFEFRDLGGWEGVSEFWRKDRAGNRIAAVRKGVRPLLIGARGNWVRPGKRLIALAGVDHLVVVDTEDALLICGRSQLEQIREVVRRLEEQKAVKYL